MSTVATAGQSPTGRVHPQMAPDGAGRAWRAESLPRPFGPSAFGHLRKQFGWSIAHDGGQARLCLGNGMVAVVVPHPAGSEVAAWLRRQGLCGPVIETTATPRAWMFLADRNGLVVSWQDLPDGVAVLDCPAQVPLPRPGPAGNVRWAVSPDTQRCLPLLASVVAAAREIIPAARAGR